MNLFNSVEVKSISRSRCNECKKKKMSLFSWGCFCLSQVEIEITFETRGITIDMQEIQTELQLSTYEKSAWFSSDSQISLHLWGDVLQEMSLQKINISTKDTESWRETVVLIHNLCRISKMFRFSFFFLNKWDTVYNLWYKM